MLFVEGFDPADIGNTKPSEEKYGEEGYSSVIDNADYLELNENFDLYYLDFEDCTLSIKENAKLFEERFASSMWNEILQNILSLF